MKRYIKTVLTKIRKFFLAPLVADSQEIKSVLANNMNFGAHQTQLPSSDITKAVQIMLSMQYKQLLHNDHPIPKFEEVGFRATSQFDEDGILLFIFSLAGVTNKKLVDIGASSVQISNTSNLIINHGWTGLLLEANEESVNSSRDFYASCDDTSIFPPTLVQTWITAENINSTIQEHGYSGSIDLVSIDIDGVDYWVWKALEVISPRVIVLEYQAVWGPDRSVTVPYRPDFEGGFTSDGRFGIYCGASLAAFIKLGKEKGYRLVGCHRYGFNAFFIRNDVASDIFPEVSAAECFKHPFPVWAHETLLEEIIDREWVEV